MIDKYTGQRVTEVFYNDAAETEILWERFEQEGFEIGLQNTNVDEDDGIHRGGTSCVSLMFPRELDTGFEDLTLFFRRNGVIDFTHQCGGFSATAKQIQTALRFLENVKAIKRVLD